MRDKRIHKMAGINHGKDAPDNGRKLIRAFSPASLNWLPRTLSKAIKVTTATVNYNHDNRNGDWVEN